MFSAKDIFSVGLFGAFKKDAASVACPAAKATSACSDASTIARARSSLNCFLALRLWAVMRSAALSSPFYELRIILERGEIY